MSEISTEKLAEVLRGMLHAVPKLDDFGCGATEKREEGGYWFYVAHTSGAEFSVAVLDRDSLANAEMVRLRRFAELVGPIISDPGVLIDLGRDEMATDEQITEMYDLAGELGVRGP